MPTEKKLPKGSRLAIIRTSGLQKGHYDLFNIVGLTEGKVTCIREALKVYEEAGSVLAPDILDIIGRDN